MKPNIQYFSSWLRYQIMWILFASSFVCMVLAMLSSSVRLQMVSDKKIDGKTADHWRAGNFLAYVLSMNIFLRAIVETYL